MLSPGYSCGRSLQTDRRQAYSSLFFPEHCSTSVSSEVSEAHGNVTAVVGCETSTCIVRVSVTLYNEEVWGLYPVLDFYQLTNLVY